MSTNETICGVEVRPLSLGMAEYLVEARNPFIIPGPIHRDDVIAFLWRVSPHYRIAPADELRALEAQVRNLPAEELMFAIRDYVVRHLGLKNQSSAAAGENSSQTAEQVFRHMLALITADGGELREVQDTPVLGFVQSMQQGNKDT